MKNKSEGNNRVKITRAQTRLFGLLAASCAVSVIAPAAAAGEICGAATHKRYDETRAFFQDSLAACRPDQYCSVVVAILAPGDDVAYRQQLRIARPLPQTPYRVILTAVLPMAEGDGNPMTVKLGRSTIDISKKQQTEGNVVNEYVINDQALADSLVAKIKASKNLTWRYQGEGGTIADASFPLRGVSAALAWIDCMGANPAAPAGEAPAEEQPATAPATSTPTPR